MTIESFLLQKHGTSDNFVCIEAPLSSIPYGGCSTNPTMPINSTKFFHYSKTVTSSNSLCVLLETWDVADEFGLAPNGWKDWLRPNSIKTIIELSDDGVSCGDYDDLNNVVGGASAADAFNAALTALSPTHFGTATNPNYKFHSIIGVSHKDNYDISTPYLYTDPIIVSECTPGATDPGTGYQGLSILTQGLRFGLCDISAYPEIFNVLAFDIINNATLD